MTLFKALTARPASDRAERSADEVADDVVELLAPLDEHEMAAAIGLIEDLEARAGDLLVDPDLRLSWHEAGPAADHQRRRIQTRDRVTPIGRAVVVEQGRRMPAWHPEVAVDDPVLDIVLGW